MLSLCSCLGNIEKEEIKTCPTQVGLSTSEVRMENIKELILLAILGVLGLIACVVFALPTSIAMIRKHPYKWIIFGLNMIFGATGIGYFIAFAWAVWPKMGQTKEKALEPSKEFSFDLPNGVSSKRTKEEEFYQTEILTKGTLIVIQEYEDLDSPELQDNMIDILFEDDATEGYEITKTAAEKKLADGTTLIGKKAIAKLGEKENTCYVFPYSSKNMDLFIVTLIYNDELSKDKTIRETFWKTLRISG